MTQIFQNLIANALKYRSDQRPLIRIECREEATDHVFSVRDNEMGIASDYHEQIFGLFKRLHGRGIAGTGLGLAICKRIVERNGGHIWVESELGQGALFCFTVPRMRQRLVRGDRL